MSFPESLKAAIEQLCRHHSHQEAVAQLSERYRHQNQERYIVTDQQRLAYLVARMPATFAAVANVLSHTSELIPELNPKSLLDLGSGPGTASWAATEHFPNLRSLTLLEQDQHMINLGKKLAQNSDKSAFKTANWLPENLLNTTKITPHDLIIFSYSIGELPQDAWKPLLETAWKNANQALIIIEPGTPVGFEKIRFYRNLLLEMKANIAAPCPHEQACPMANGDWCHFAQRLERTIAHRKAKEASLSYEDEKFSYIAVTKLPITPIQGRILRHPGKHTGHVTLKICHQDGTVHQTTISKRDKELYKWARKAEWGDAIINI